MRSRGTLESADGSVRRPRPNATEVPQPSGPRIARGSFLCGTANRTSGFAPSGPMSRGEQLPLRRRSSPSERSPGGCALAEVRVEFVASDQCPSAVFDAGELALGEQVVDSLALRSEQLGGFRNREVRRRPVRDLGASGEDLGGPLCNPLDVHGGELDRHGDRPQIGSAVCLRIQGGDSRGSSGGSIHWCQFYHITGISVHASPAASGWVRGGWLTQVGLDLGVPRWQMK
jgi:hypothetical protein